MKIIKTDWDILKEAEEQGFVAAMTSLLERYRTPLNEQLSTYFRTNMSDYSGIFDEDICEDVLYAMNKYIEEEKIEKFKQEIDFPYSSGSDIYLIPITENLQLKVLVTDEYYGDGDYSKYIDMTYFVITPKATEQDVDKLIEAVKRMTEF